MNMQEDDDYTARQLREREYRRARAAGHRRLAGRPAGYDAALSDVRRWRNPCWALYAHPRGLGPGGRVLVAGTVGK
jgi:hypothetical protein